MRNEPVLRSKEPLVTINDGRLVYAFNSDDGFMYRFDRETGVIAKFSQTPFAFTEADRARALDLVDGTVVLMGQQTVAGFGLGRCAAVQRPLSRAARSGMDARRWRGPRACAPAWLRSRPACTRPPLPMRPRTQKKVPSGARSPRSCRKASAHLTEGYAEPRRATTCASRGSAMRLRPSRATSSSCWCSTKIAA